MNVPGVFECSPCTDLCGVKTKSHQSESFCSHIKSLFGFLKIILISVLSFLQRAHIFRPCLVCLDSVTGGLMFRPLVTYSRFKWTILDLLKVMSSTKVW